MLDAGGNRHLRQNLRENRGSEFATTTASVRHFRKPDRLSCHPKLLEIFLVAKLSSTA
jgi:hypothetical protein